MTNDGAAESRALSRFKVPPPDFVRKVMQPLDRGRCLPRRQADGIETQRYTLPTQVLEA